MSFTPDAPVLESDLLDDVSFDIGWTLLERFSSLVRESGSEDEHVAAEYIASELGRMGCLLYTSPSPRD